MISLYIALGLTALAAVCVFYVWFQAKRIKNYRAENESLLRANRDAALRLEHIREYTAKNKIIAEKAEHEKQELEKTADSGLVHRADSLFGGGVRGPGGGGNGGT